MEIWKKMWVGVFFWTQCKYCIIIPDKEDNVIGLVVIYLFIGLCAE